MSVRGWQALSLRRPWSWATEVAGKVIENRGTNASFRGAFLLHAAKECTDAEYFDAALWMERRGLIRRASTPMTKASAALPLLPALDDMKRGGIYAVACLTDVLAPTAGTLPNVDTKPAHPAIAWHMPEKYGYVLARVHVLPFLPYRGMQGFFPVAPAAVEMLGLPPEPSLDFWITDPRAKRLDRLHE